VELLDLDTYCLEILEGRPHRQSKHCFRSAINHLKRAESLFPIDSNMAVFRCFTAEEEAASGLMYCLKDKKYVNANKLKPKRHVHKISIIQFFTVFNKFTEEKLSEIQLDMRLSVIEKNSEKMLAFETMFDLGHGPKKFNPEPPFNFRLLFEKKRFSFREQIQDLFKAREFSEIESYLENEANQRNLLLYATQQGYPSKVEVEEKFFPAYQKRVFALLRAYLMIDPYEEKQPFVQDILDAFLTMLREHNLTDVHDEL